MQLSSIPLRSPLTSQSPDSFIFPSALAGDQASVAPSFSSVLTADTATDLTASTTSASTAAPRGRSQRGSLEPSGLSLLLAHEHEDAAAERSHESLITPTAERPYPSPIQVVVTDTSRQYESESPHQPSERSPLLDVEAVATPYTNGHGSPDAVSKRTSRGVFSRWRGKRPIKHVGDVLTTSMHAVPAVILGTLLNILDGISCMYLSLGLELRMCLITEYTDGMITFPAAGVFTGLGGIGVSMFFVS